MKSENKSMLADLPGANKLFYSEEISHKLVLEFFMLFSRFEYALKRADYLAGNKKHTKPDWKAFARAVSQKFSPRSDPELKKAVDYLLKDPPKKQVVINKNLEWEKVSRRKNASDAEYVLRLVRTVRNNLFHGGKYPQVLISEVSRDRELIRYSIIILKVCLMLERRVVKYFGEVSWLS